MTFEELVEYEITRASTLKLCLLRVPYFMNRFMKKCIKRWDHYNNSIIFSEQESAVKQTIKILTTND